MEQYKKNGPKIHCLTNPVVMQDTANLLLAAGGSAIMAQAPEEVEEVTSFCQAALLNIGVPDEAKFKACVLAGKRANALGHPVVLDPVGAGASRFRQKGLEQILSQVKVSIIRCNQEEACTLLRMKNKNSNSFGETEMTDEESPKIPIKRTAGGVESQIDLEDSKLRMLAGQLSEAYSCTVLISGKKDAVSDGKDTCLIAGGTERMSRLTGGGCMLSALCALCCGCGYEPYTAAWRAGELWKESARRAEMQNSGTVGIGSFHAYLFDAVEELCRSKDERGEGKR